MASSMENRKFNEDILPQWLLDEAIDWIDFSLQESLFEDVLNQAFYESETKS